jgi:hypothetical protein
MPPVLVIRNAQMAALASASFEAWLLQHARRFFAATCDQLGAAGTTSLVREMAARARHHGLSEAADICSYIDLACTFGRDFDSALPWAESILAAADGHASTITMDRLHEAAMEALATDAAQLAPVLEDADAGAAIADAPGAADVGTPDQPADLVAAKSADA